MLLQNVGHHLVGAGRLEDLKQLLASPGWLERKLHSYGTASAVADFRRWGAAHVVIQDMVISFLQHRRLTVPASAKSTTLRDQMPGAFEHLLPSPLQVLRPHPCYCVRAGI